MSLAIEKEQIDTAASSITNRGFHPILKHDHPYIFVDTCVQIWPDADYKNAHRHGATVYGVTSWTPHPTLSEALESIMYWHLVARRHENIVIVEAVDDIRNAKQEHQAALLLAAQDGDFIGDKLHRIEAFYRLGLRMMLPAYNRSNFICSGCLDCTDSGLTSFGKLVVDECNRVGLLLDCSHISYRASMEMMERSRQPVVFSHSNAKALVDNPRNITDEQIKTCAAVGGVIGVVAWGPLLLQEGATQQPTIDDVIEHVDYFAQLTGSTDHIGLGTDFSLGTYPEHGSDPWGNPDYANVRGDYDRVVPTPGPTSPQRFAQGFSTYPQILNFIDKLKLRGYTDMDVRKILGENYLRVFEQVWI